MALISTVAGATANSYLSVADADAFAAADFGPEVDAWNAADTASKEKALIRATRELDAYLRSSWPRYSATQTLLFPRASDYTTGPTPVLPENLRLACYEQATYVLSNADALDAAAVRWARANQGEVVAQSEANGDYMLSPAAKSYLEGFRRAGGMQGIRSTRLAAG